MANLDVIKEQIKALNLLEAVELAYDVLEGRMEPKENFTLGERMALAEFDLKNAKNFPLHKRAIFAFVTLAVGVAAGVSMIASIERQRIAADARKSKPPEDPAPVN